MAAFATEDGVLIYDHSKDVWQEPVTATQGLDQYPALLVWLDETSRDLWIVTPDQVFLYNLTTRWTRRERLPESEQFSGKYRLGISHGYVVVAAENADQEAMAALYSRASGILESWGRADTVLADIQLNLRWLPHFAEDTERDVRSLTLADGMIGADMTLKHDRLPQNDRIEVSCAGKTPEGRLFVGTQGYGLLQQLPSTSLATSLGHGLLSPDVMSLNVYGDQVLVGGRAGITLIDEDLRSRYERALEQVVFDLEFVSALVRDERGVYAAARGGVFHLDNEGDWQRLLSVSELKDERIYDLAVFQGWVAAATRQGVILQTPAGEEFAVIATSQPFPVFDVEIQDNVLWMGTVYGILAFPLGGMSPLLGLGSDGRAIDLNQSLPYDPIYELHFGKDACWAATTRGVIQFTKEGKMTGSWLSPLEPFTPRGLWQTGDHIWVGTEAGIQILDTRDGDWLRITTHEGLVSNFITDLHGSPRYIYAGTNFGLARITWKNIPNL